MDDQVKTQTAPSDFLSSEEEAINPDREQNAPYCSCVPHGNHVCDGGSR